MRRIWVLGVVVIAACALAACGGDDGGKQRTAPTASTSSPSSPPQQEPVDDEEDGRPDPFLELRHDGYRDLRLGTTAGQASSTGQLTVIGRGRCREFILANFGDGGGPHGYVDARRGLTVLFGRYQMATSEGVGVGATRGALGSAYPGLRRSQGLWVAPVTSTTEYFFRLGDDRRVEAFGVRLTGNRCMPRANAW